MMALARRVDEELAVGEDLEVKVLAMSRGRVRLSIVGWDGPPVRWFARGERIEIRPDVVCVPTRITNGRVVLSIEAPRSIPISWPKTVATSGKETQPCP